MEDYSKKYQPEKLGLYDRFFNRYRRIPIQDGSETWTKRYCNYWSEWFVPYNRDFIVYEIVDRLTGSVKIEKEYLN